MSPNREAENAIVLGRKCLITLAFRSGGVALHSGYEVVEYDS